jgi:arylsulfatase A-like enzyme
MPEQHIDGVSFVDVLKNPSSKHERAPLFWHYPHWGNQGGIPSSAIRDGDWKLIVFYFKKEPELYNLADDPRHVGMAFETHQPPADRHVD